MTENKKSSNNANVYIIAEAGVNHNGDRQTAFDLIDTAVESGANAIKFQTFKASNIVTKYADKAEYQKQKIIGEDTQYKMLKDLELPYELHFELKEYCEENGIDFLSTAFDIESLEFLSEKLNLNKLKIPSGEITNAPLILEFAKTGKEIILSTGMSSLEEIKDALSVIACGFLDNKQDIERLSSEKLLEAFNSDIGKTCLESKITLLHCITAYPTPRNEVNLNSIGLIQDTFNLPVGFSDHTEGYLASLAAVSKGACTIEKHFTLDKNAKGPDHQASLEPIELREMIECIRSIEEMQGERIKNAMPCELENLPIARKSLVAASDINKGEIFTKKNVTTKRAGNGITPMKIWDLISTKAAKDYKEDELI